MKKLFSCIKSIASFLAKIISCEIKDNRVQVVLKLWKVQQHKCHEEVEENDSNRYHQEN